jgi:hypothetical protein
MTHDLVMAGLVPAIHVLFPESKTWMPGTRPGMTVEMLCHGHEDYLWIDRSVIVGCSPESGLSGSQL